ncbi:site-specific integrase [uncultured Propionivibrio sp.]|uniref:site-specific integrase n=1 Tax=uncultured Propionivibrio sp. TaxID=426737 RepID=UPI0029C01F16|nr:site-specific integrase [uncultured Propionivibrio sp.]
MATIRQRGSRWQCIIKRKGHPTISQSFDIKRDAEKWGRQQERLMDAGQWVDISEAASTSLGELLERYSREITPTKRGCYAELSRIRVVRRAKIAQFSVAAITGPLLAEWRDSRLKEVSGTTVCRELSLISHAYTVAIREWGFSLQSNPTSFVRKPPEGKPRDRILTTDQRSALVAACSECRNPWVKPVVIFALETATRRGEILSLTWPDVDLKHRIAKVNGKTGPRAVPLSPVCMEMLGALPRGIDGQVFPVTVETLKQAYGRAVARAGIADFTFHDLRHDALTRLAKMGFNVLELRAISGHTTANMLQRYVSIDAGDLAEKLGRSALKQA